MSVRERLDLEREDRRHEGTLARLGGRFKFTCCRRCGRVDGMQPVHRNTLTEMTNREIEMLASWYRYDQSLTDDYLYYPCPRCNIPIVIPDDFIPVLTEEVLTDWRQKDSMEPDYAALAAEPEAATAGEDSRESAGWEE